MSLIDLARAEMQRAQFSPGDVTAMEKILGIFFETWDSGGAVAVMQPILHRCIAGKCLTPLTGADDEWMNVSRESGRPMWQNRRCSTVFKDHTRAYDIDTPGRPSITFPYWPEESRVRFPLMEG